MTDLEASKPEEHTRHYDIAVLAAAPVGTTQYIEIFFKAAAESGARAVIITGFATGTVPQDYFPFIVETTEKGIPVFVISSNRAEEHGPQEIRYGAQQETLEAKATILSDVNVNSAWEVADTIQDAIEEGYSGEALRQAMVDIFGTLDLN